MRLVDTIKRIKTLAETLPDDDPDKLELLDTECDFSNLMEWALVKRNEAISSDAAAKALAQKYTDRSKSFGKKAEHMKSIVGWIMTEANETKYKGVAGTVSIGNKKQGVIVTDESKIPDEYFKTARSLDKAKLNKAVLGGEEIQGAAKDNGGTTLTIRT